MSKPNQSESIQKITTKEVLRPDRTGRQGGEVIGFVQINRAGNPLIDSKTGKVLFGFLQQNEGGDKGLNYVLEGLENEQKSIRVGADFEIELKEKLRSEINQMVENMDGKVWNKIQGTLTKFNRGKIPGGLSKLAHSSDLGVEEKQYFQKAAEFEKLKNVVSSYDEMLDLEDEYREEINDVKKTISEIKKQSNTKDVVWKAIDAGKEDQTIGNLKNNLGDNKFSFEIDEKLYQDLKKEIATPKKKDTKSVHFPSKAKLEQFQENDNSKNQTSNNDNSKDNQRGRKTSDNNLSKEDSKGYRSSSPTRFGGQKNNDKSEKTSKLNDFDNKLEDLLNNNNKSFAQKVRQSQNKSNSVKTR